MKQLNITHRNDGNLLFARWRHDDRSIASSGSSSSLRHSSGRHHRKVHGTSSSRRARPVGIGCIATRLPGSRHLLLWRIVAVGMALHRGVGIVVGSRRRRRHILWRGSRRHWRSGLSRGGVDVHSSRCAWILWMNQRRWLKIGRASRCASWS
jgi:hypothetical protein